MKIRNDDRCTRPECGGHLILEKIKTTEKLIVVTSSCTKCQINVEVKRKVRKDVIYKKRRLN